MVIYHLKLERLIEKQFKQVNALKGYEICDCILLISKQIFMLRLFSKDEKNVSMIKKIIAVRPSLVKMLFIVIFIGYVSTWHM